MSPAARVPCRRLLLIAAVCAASPTTADAAERVWLAPVGGAWTTPSLWDSGVPGTLDSALFGGSGGDGAFLVTASTAVTVDSLRVVNQSPTFQFSTPDFVDFVVNGTVTVAGRSAPVWRFENNRARPFGITTIGDATGPGTLIVAGASASELGWYSAQAPVLVGNQGVGEWRCDPYSNSNINHLDPSVVGDGVGAIGAISIVGPSATLSLANAMPLILGRNGGVGTLVIGPGGKCDNPGTISVGGDGTALPGTAGTGSVLIDGGQLSDTGSPVGELRIGVEGIGSLTVHAGSVIKNRIRIGVAGGSGDMLVDGSAALADVWIGFGSSHASAVITGPASIVNAKKILVATAASSTLSECTLTNGATVTATQLNIGSQGAGRVRIDGGATLDVNGGCFFATIDGPSTPGSGVLDVSGAGSALTVDSISFGPDGSSAVSVSDGASVVCGPVTWTVGGTATIDVGSGSSLFASNAVGLGAGSLTIDATAQFTCAALTTTYAVATNWTLGDALPTGASLAAPSVQLAGPIHVTFQGRTPPAAGTIIPLVSSAAVSETAPSLTLPVFHDYPPLWLATPQGRSLHVIDHVDAIGVPQTVSMHVGEVITLPTLITVGSETADMSRVATWDFAPAGIVARVGPDRFGGVGAGTTVATVHYGAASATVSFEVTPDGRPPFDPPPYLLASGFATGPGGVWGNGESLDTDQFFSTLGLGVTSDAFSTDGRFIAFSSESSNLVPNDSGTSRDVFVKDLVLNLIERVSVGLTATGGERGSISADGRYVAFESSADLAPGAGAGTSSTDIFLRDRLAQSTELVNVPLAGQINSSGANKPRVSGDGRFVAFESTATNLVAGDTNAARDVFLRDRVAGTTTRASLSTTGQQLGVASTLASIAADGTSLVFLRRIQGWMHAYRYDINSGVVELLTTGLATSVPAINVQEAHLSSDGRYLAFVSAGFGVLVAEPVSPIAQLYRRDLLLGVTEPVSVTQDGAWSTAPIEAAAISGVGRFLTFTSKAVNLAPDAPGGGQGLARLFRKDMLTGAVELIALADDLPFNATVNPFVAISGTGSRIAFVTNATNVIDGAPAVLHQVYAATRPVPPLGDLDGDFIVGSADLAILLGAWGTSRGDLDGDGVVGGSDLTILLGAWTN